MRVLVLGCGYVGSSLADTLAKAGHQVFGVRRHWGPAASAPGAIVRLTADLTQPAELRRLPGPFDWVVNCTSSSGGGETDYRRIYLEGTQHLLAWLADQPPARFVYTSSTGVYAQNDGSEVDEDSPAEPKSGTGEILRQTERQLQSAATGGFPAVILRVAGIYGPGRGYWLKQFVAGEARLDGDGTRILNQIHRDDVVTAIINALERGQPGRIYNAVDNEPVSLVTLLTWLAARLNRPLPPLGDGSTPAGRRESTSKRVSNRRLRSELGWRAQFPTFHPGYEAELARLGFPRTPDAPAPASERK